MRSTKLTLLLTAALLGTFTFSAFGQTDVFSDTHAEYTFAIPDARWKLTVKPTAVLSNADFVYGDRADGRLEIRKLTVPRDQILSDLIHGPEEAKLAFRPGFVAGRDENFSGKLRGTVYNFEYVAAGKSMAGRNYYLRANETTVYLLKFSGLKDDLKSLQNQSDVMARTFSLK